MKKFKKLAYLILIVMLCTSLIGCNKIDEMRLAQIHFNENGNLVYDGQEYKAIPYREAFSPNFSEGKKLYITEKDVPVLLSEMYGQGVELSNDKLYILSYSASTSKFGECTYYARSDIYTSICARIDAGDYFDGYLYSCSFYDVDTAEFQHVDKFVSDEIKVAIDNIMSGESEPEIDISLLYQFKVLDIWEASKDKLFKQHALTIYKTEKYIYLASNENNKVYIVSEDNVSIFEELIKEYETLTKNNQNDDNIFME